MNRHPHQPQAYGTHMGLEVLGWPRPRHGGWGQRGHSAILLSFEVTLPDLGRSGQGSGLVTLCGLVCSGAERSLLG